MSTREAVICEPVRTPIGRYGGMFKSLTAVDLSDPQAPKSLWASPRVQVHAIDGSNFN